MEQTKKFIPRVLTVDWNDEFLDEPLDKPEVVPPTALRTVGAIAPSPRSSSKKKPPVASPVSGPVVTSSVSGPVASPVSGPASVAPTIVTVGTLLSSSEEVQESLPVKKSSALSTNTRLLTGPVRGRGVYQRAIKTREMSKKQEKEVVSSTPERKTGMNLKKEQAATFLSSKRFNTERFRNVQKYNLDARRKVVKLLNLKDSDSEDWITIPPQKGLEEHQNFPEISALKGLMLVNTVSMEGKVTPSDIQNKARGVILFNDQVIRQSIPFNETVICDMLIPQHNNKIVFEIKGTDGSPSQEIPAHMRDIKITPYVEGTIISVILINDVMHWFTSRNLLPQGLEVDASRLSSAKRKEIALKRSEGKSKVSSEELKGKVTIVKKARMRPYDKAFTDSFREILQESHPQFLNRDILFPGGCKSSKWEYRFLLLTRERVRAYHGYIPPNGFLVYLGPIKHWSNKSAKFPGPYHKTEDLYIPSGISPKDIPKDKDKSYVVQFDNMTIEEANRYLRGDLFDKRADPRFSDGGKLVVEINTLGKDRHVIKKTIHVESTGYAHRFAVVGGGEDLYTEFLSKLNIRNYDFMDEKSLEKFTELFPTMILPGNPSITPESIREEIALGEALPVMFSKYLPTQSLVRLIWYNFLVCSNVTVRDEVYKFARRYRDDMTFLQSWLANEKNAYKNALDDKDERRIKHCFDVYECFIKRDPRYSDKRFEEVVLSIQEPLYNLINTSRKFSRTLQTSLQISNPEAVLPPYKSYRAVLLGEKETA